MSDLSMSETENNAETKAGEFVGADADDLEALDALFRRSDRYRSTEEYRNLLDFVGKLFDYSPYNAALLHVQDPGVT